MQKIFTFCQNIANFIKALGTAFFPTCITFEAIISSFEIEHATLSTKPIRLHFIVVPIIIFHKTVLDRGSILILQDEDSL